MERVKGPLAGRHQNSSSSTYRVRIMGTNERKLTSTGELGMWRWRSVSKILAASREASSQPSDS